MRGPGQVKREFLKKWTRGLQIYENTNNNMSLLERKNAIKLSADVAMACTKLNTSHWSRALISDATNLNGGNHTASVVVQHILGDNTKKVAENVKQSSGSSSVCVANHNKKVRSKKILRKSCGHGKVEKVLASEIAKKMVKRRTQKLKSLVPGGESMDNALIIKEALDYIVSLQLQVNLMRQVVKVSES